MKNKDKAFEVRIHLPEKEKNQLEDMADKQGGRSVQSIIRQIITERLEDA